MASVILDLVNYDYRVQGYADKPVFGIYGLHTIVLPDGGIFRSEGILEPLPDFEPNQILSGARDFSEVSNTRDGRG